MFSISEYFLIVLSIEQHDAISLLYGECITRIWVSYASRGSDAVILIEARGF